MSTVLVRKASYDYAVLKPLVFEMMDLFCRDAIKAGSRVLIKPNLLLPAAPDRAIVTHPLIVRASAEYALDRGAKVRISDSNAMGSFEKVIAESGLKDALRGMDVELSELKASTLVDVGEPFKKIEIAKDALEADVVVNLPKLKTHVQMRMTLGVKNLFGCIVGLRKPEWHFRTGVNREMFAKLLVKIHQAINPAVTIMDGILCLEGEGPGKSGDPRPLGVMMASDNTFALDSVACTMVGMNPDSLFTIKAAGEMGLMPETIEVMGELPAVHDFKFPDMVPLVFGPKPLHGFMRRRLVQRPAQDLKLCKLCGECWKYCPAKAISRSGKKLVFDYEECIRCYCCIEVCPHAAMKTEEPMLGRLFKRVKKNS
jgi:uncharacterized protein (DUF362 family)/Pyruvate/2-oxoacid:ferredoxin oxidoreductase delta subunit